MVDRIRELLQARQLSPTQFADAIGVARPIISHILSGRNKPSLEVVQKIIAAFPDLSLPWLLSGIGAMRATETTIAAPLPSAPSPPTPPTIRQIPPKAVEKPFAVPNRFSIERNPPKTELASSQVSERVTPTASPIPTKSSALPLSSKLPLSAVETSVLEDASLDSSGSQVVGSHVAVEPNIELDEGLATANRERISGVKSAIAQHIPHDATGFSPTSNSGSPTVLDKSIRRVIIFYKDGTFTDYRPES